MNKIALFVLVSMVFACADQPMGEPTEEKASQNIVGSWLFVEYGYSPGDKYYIVPVSPEPPQTINFKADFTMSSDNMELDKFKYYRILEDTTFDTQVIAFLEEDPGNKQLVLADLNTTYNISWDGNALQLSYRWCFEGCHMKFKRTTTSE